MTALFEIKFLGFSTSDSTLFFSSTSTIPNPSGFFTYWLNIETESASLKIVSSFVKNFSPKIKLSPSTVNDFHMVLLEVLDL